MCDPLYVFVYINNININIAYMEFQKVSLRVSLT